MMGYGYFIMEELLWDKNGALITDGPHKYTIPCVRDIPAEFNITLLRDCPNPRAVYSSKVISLFPILFCIYLFIVLDVILWISNPPHKVKRLLKGTDPFISFHFIRQYHIKHFTYSIKITKKYGETHNKLNLQTSKRQAHPG